MLALKGKQQPENAVKQEQNLSAFMNSSNISPSFEKFEHSTESSISEESGKAFGVLRRGPFKPSKQQAVEGEYPNMLSQAKGKKGANPSANKRIPSKAKHLWINFGRKIIEYAVNHTNGEVSNKLKGYIGKLGSKKDFETVFKVIPSDNQQEKELKILFGGLALKFVKYESENAFINSRYQDHMTN